MTHTQRARVIKNCKNQAIDIPAEFRFSANEVYIRRDPDSGDVILSQAPNWDEIFAALDEAGFPDDFLADREQDALQERDNDFNPIKW